MCRGFLLVAVALACVHSAPLTDDAYNLISNAHFIRDGPKPTISCLVKSCPGPMAKCAINKDCRSALECTAGCGGTNQTCIFQCTSDYENEVYDEMIKCFFTDHDCMKLPGKNQTFDPYGSCRSMEVAAPLTTYRGKPMTQDQIKTLLTRNGKDLGFWLVTKGLSHAYDCFDCQRLFFNTAKANTSQLDYYAIYKIHKTDGTFRWNTADYSVDWDTWPQPGRMHLRAPDYGGLVHTEDWRVLALDETTENDPQWVALYYCGGAPGVKENYEGSCVMTPKGVMPSDPAAVKKIEDAYKKAGITLACVPNNTAAACDGHPNPPAQLA